MGTWYYLNHAHRYACNVRMEVRRVSRTAERIVWIATRHVSQGDELRYTYGGVVPAYWQDAYVFGSHHGGSRPNADSASAAF